MKVILKRYDIVVPSCILPVYSGGLAPWLICIDVKKNVKDLVECFRIIKPDRSMLSGY